MPRPPSPASTRPDVTELYSPNATWPAVREALQGASLVVYMGHGNGWPSKYRDALYPPTQNGFGLNPKAGTGDYTHQYFGEASVGEQVKLAKNAVVLLNHLCYASGNTEPGLPEGNLAQAKQRVDNYAAGFIQAGASAVIAEAWSSPSYFVKTILSSNRSIQSAWSNAPSANRHRLAFKSERSKGYVAQMDTETATSGFTRSVVMKTGLASRDVLAGAAGSRVRRLRGRRNRSVHPARADPDRHEAQAGDAGHQAAAVGRDQGPRRRRVQDQGSEGTPEGRPGQRPLGSDRRRGRTRRPGQRSRRRRFPGRAGGSCRGSRGPRHRPPPPRPSPPRHLRQRPRPSRHPRRPRRTRPRRSLSRGQAQGDGGNHERGGGRTRGVSAERRCMPRPRLRHLPRRVRTRRLKPARPNRPHHCPTVRPSRSRSTAGLADDEAGVLGAPQVDEPDVTPRLEIPAEELDLVVPERVGDVVAPAAVKFGKKAMSVPVTMPTVPGKYRLTITLHDADGVVYDAATQALIPSLIVRVTGDFDGAILATPTAELVAGTDAELDVRAINLGLTGWGHDAITTASNLIGGGAKAHGADVVGRWIPLSFGAALPTDPDAQVVRTELPIGLQPGVKVDTVLDLVAPTAPGQYLLMLDIVTPERGSLVAAGADPTLIRVTVLPAN